MKRIIQINKSAGLKSRKKKLQKIKFKPHQQIKG